MFSHGAVSKHKTSERYFLYSFSHASDRDTLTYISYPTTVAGHVEVINFPSAKGGLSYTILRKVRAGQ